MYEEIYASARALDAVEITEITEENEYATAQGKPLPPFTRVKLTARPTSASDIRIELWLPKDWNGIFLGTGNGGMAGLIRIEKLEQGLLWGCATAHTDMGTSNGVRRGVGSKELWEDFGWRSTKIMTDVGKALTRAHYGREIGKSYFIGNSTGGQQALTMAQRFPADYDGIVAGVPVTDRLHLHTYFLWMHTALHDEQGNPLFRAEEVPEITRLAVKYGRAKGLLKENQSFFTESFLPKKHANDFVDFLAAESGFSEAQIEALRKVYVGPFDPEMGERIYCGMPIGAESMRHGIADCLGERCPFFFIFQWLFGVDYDGRRFDFSADLRRLDEAMAQDLNAENADLSPFFARGGKLFMFSGSADPCVPYPPTLHYFGKVVETCGAEETYKHMRYFVIPGQDHGAGVARYGKAVMNGEREIRGNLDVIRAWVEEGIAPGSFDVVTPNGEEYSVERVFAWE